MLQQTQVATVIDYFNRFIGKFSDVHQLAAAPREAVIRQWQGLGYYRRAAHLHRCAQAIVEQYGGQIPKEISSLQKLPGIGRYSAGAIASMAFGRAVGVVDGNVARVFARWLALQEPIDDTVVRRQLWQIADEFASEITAAVAVRSMSASCRALHAGDWNQALMELGATVCLPRHPQCGRCPVRRWCNAAALDRPHALPVRARRGQPRAVAHHVIAVRSNGRWLVEQRGSSGLWADMWQLPTWELEDRRSIDARTVRRWFEQQWGASLADLRAAHRFDHATTHRAIEFVVWHADLPDDKHPLPRGRWLTRKRLVALPMGNPQRRIINAIMGDEGITPS
jgi:A/G-specific adenine glycosylase